MDLYENCVLHYTGYDVKQYWPFMKCADAIVVSRFPNVDGISKAILDACNKELPPSVDPQVSTKYTLCHSLHPLPSSLLNPGCGHFRQETIVFQELPK